MRKRTLKTTAMLILTSGCLFQLGCMGNWWNWMLRGVGGSIVTEWLTDNNSVWDIFPDGPTQ